MSSTYDLICASHDPALTTINGEWSDLSRALTAVGGAGVHGGCDLVIGRWSGALISITCPPNSPAAACHGRHREPETIDVEWLWLLHKATAYPELSGPVEWVHRRFMCWHPQRVTRLAGLIDVESNTPATRA